MPAEITFGKHKKKKKIYTKSCFFGFKKNNSPREGKRKYIIQQPCFNDCYSVYSLNEVEYHHKRELGEKLSSLVVETHFSQDISEPTLDAICGPIRLTCRIGFIFKGSKRASDKSA